MNKHQFKRAALLFILILLICASVVLSIKCDERFLNSFSSLVSASCSIITLIIAILLYNRFGIGRNLKDKNFMAVDNLMEDLLNTRIEIEIVNNKNKNHNSIAYLCNIDFQSDFRQRIDLKDLHLDAINTKSMNLYYTKDAVNVLSQIQRKHIRNLYMPSSIVDKLMHISSGGHTIVYENQIEDECYCIIYAINENIHKRQLPYDSQHNKELWLPLGDDVQAEVFQYFNNLDELKRACLRWLSKNGGGGDVNCTPVYK